jgi:hypothetical protein
MLIFVVYFPTRVNHTPLITVEVGLVGVKELAVLF